MDVLDGSLVDGITITDPLPRGEKIRFPLVIYFGIKLCYSVRHLWRMNYSLIMYNPGNGYQYFPSAEELLISIGFVSIEVCAYILIIRLFPVLPVFKEKHTEDSEKIIAEKRQFSKKVSGAE